MSRVELIGRSVRTVVEYLAFALLLLWLSGQFEAHEGMPGLAWHKALELPLLLYLYFLLRSFVRPGRWRGVIAALPLVIVYLFLDIYYLVLGRVFRFSEISELPELIDILPWPLLITVALLLLVPLALLLMRWRWPGWRRALFALMPLMLLVAILQVRPSWFMSFVEAAAHPPVAWSDVESVRVNGRLVMVLYKAAKQQQAWQALAGYRDDPDYERDHEHRMQQLGKISERRNVHILVLEGYLDPMRLENVTFNRDPVHPDFRKLLEEGKGSLSQSPVYGGYTAQAEFEVLCEVPAKQAFSTIEFNLFSGAPVHCMPDALNAIGYRTMATEAFKPEFFNARAALRGTGFKETYFPREYAPADNSYLSTGDVSVEEYLFDADLLEQNRSFVDSQLQSSEQPLLNYVMTIYGHWPFAIDESKRPKLISVKAGSKISADMLAVANQIWYRSKAIADHINALKQRDPNAIIIVLADHLPPMPRGKSEYADMGYLPQMKNSSKLTFLAAFDRGKKVPLRGMHHYDVPSLIYSLLLGKPYCETPDCKPRTEEELINDYRRLMAHAVAPLTQ